MVDRSTAEHRKAPRRDPAVDVDARTAEIAWIADMPGFDALREEWDALADRERLPFLRHAWFSAWWRAFGGDRTLAICVLRRGGSLDAAFPLAEAPGRLESLAHPHHAPVFRPLSADTQALETVVEAAVAARPGELVVHSLPQDDAAVGLLARRAGRPLVVEPQHVSPVVDTVGGDFGSYRSAFDRGKRKDIERRRRRFAEEHDARVEIVRPEDLDAALAEALALEERGWKGVRGTAMGQEAGAGAFYDAVARAFHGRDRFRLARIVAGERLVAFDLCLLDYDRLWVLKGAYDEEFARFAPGLSLTYAEVEWCFEQGLEALELLGDDEPWKRIFSTAERRHCGVRAYRRRPVPAARYAWRAAVRPALRHAYRRVRPVRRGRP